MKKSGNTKFCPKCKSTDVEIKLDATNAIGTPQYIQCNKCKFWSIDFPTISKILPEPVRKIKLTSPSRMSD